VAQLTQRLEADLRLASSPAAIAAAAGASTRQSAGSTSLTVQQAAGTAKDSLPAQPSRRGLQALPSQEQPQQQQPAASGGASLASGGTYATPASSLLRHSVSMETPQALPGSTASTAAAGLAVRRDSSASMEGTPELQACLTAALKKLQTGADKGSGRLARLEGIVRAIAQGGADAAAVEEASRAVAQLRQQLQEQQQGQVRATALVLAGSWEWHRMRVHLPPS
jgi:hypothetical protein